jgi:two-component system, NarL family, nitrate/nitrite response regulator NarL
MDRYGTRKLTPTEERVVELAASGLKNKEIAAQIGTTESVVKNYMCRIFDKLGLWSRLELALWHGKKGGE